MPVIKTETGYVVRPGPTTAVSQTRDPELQSLIRTAQGAGFTREAEEAQQPPRLSVLQRLGRGLSSFEPGDALYGSLYEEKPFLREYATDITKGIGSMITGKDYREEDPKKTFKDILVVEGMRDRPGKLDAVDIAGLALDIATDPTTYVGGAIGKQLSGLLKEGVNIGKRMPIIGKFIQGGDEAVKLLFKPFHKIEQLGEVGKAYRAGYETYVKGTRSAVGDFMETVAERAGRVKGIEEAGEKIAFAVETGGARGAISQIDEALEPLAKEASKYASVEEFINKGDIIFQGGVKGTESDWWTTGIEKALAFAQRKGATAGEIRIARFSDIPKELLAAGSEITGDLKTFTTKAEMLKITDVITAPTSQMNIIGRFDATGVKFAKSQLTDFYNQAVKATKEIATTGNKLLDDVMGELVSVQKAFTKEEVKRGILKTQLPDYMHHMLTKDAADYLQKGGNLQQFVKPIRVKLGAAKQRTIEGTVKGINEEFAKKLGFNLFEENAFRAFAKRGVSSIQAVKTYDFLQTTATKFGKRATKDFIDADGIKWVSSTAPQLAGTKLPEPIVKHIDEFTKILSNDEATNGLLRVFDKVQNLWKGTVTGYFPAFHTRNALGGVFNNFIAGLTDARLYFKGEKAVGKLAKETPDDVFAFAVKAGDDIGKKYTYGQFRKLTKEWGITGQTGYLDVVDYLEKTIDPSTLQKFKTAPQKVMGAVENRLRVPLFMDGLIKGYTAEEAAKRVVKFHFDYMPEAFTGFEKTVMKRVIPFYTWTRNNIPLQIEQMIMQPGKYAGVFKAQRALGMGAGTEEEQVMPRWLRERFVIKGEGGYWSGVGVPLEEATEKLSKPLRGVGVSLSPLIKTPLEVLTNYNIFKEKSISEDTYGKQYRNMPDFLQKWLQFKEHKTDEGGVYYTVNPHRKYWLELGGARGLSTILRLSNTKEDRKNVWSLITTIRKYEYDPEDLKRWSTIEKREKLEKALYNAGVIRKFETYYQP